jgi:hypothetical protein
MRSSVIRCRALEPATTSTRAALNEAVDRRAALFVAAPDSAPRSVRSPCVTTPPTPPTPALTARGCGSRRRPDSQRGRAPDHAPAPEAHVVTAGAARSSLEHRPPARHVDRHEVGRNECQVVDGERLDLLAGERPRRTLRGPVVAYGLAAVGSLNDAAVRDLPDVGACPAGVGVRLRHLGLGCYRTYCAASTLVPRGDQPVADT